MKRPLAAAAGSASLVASLIVGAAPSVQATSVTGLITVDVTSAGGVSEGLVLDGRGLTEGMTASEELVIEHIPSGAFFLPSQFIISIRDDVAEAGRRLLQPVGGGSVNCSTMEENLPEDQSTNAVLCIVTRPTQVQIDFQDIAGNTLIAMVNDVTRGEPVGMLVRGGNGRDEMYGGAGPDYLFGVGGNDSLFGGGGDDFLVGGPGDDYIEGEEGFDEIQGGSGSNSIDAADNAADEVDCGGLPAFLDYDRNVDTLRNCGSDPVPVPPAPVEPQDPPAPGVFYALVDGQQVSLEPITSTDGARSFLLPCGLAGCMTPTTIAFFGIDDRPGYIWAMLRIVRAQIMNVARNTKVSYYLYRTYRTSEPVSTAQRAQGVSTASAVPLATFTADEQGRVDGEISLPAGTEAGEYTLQLNAVNSAGAQVSVNLGVTLPEAIPQPDPEPEASIEVSSAKRGKGRKAAVITVRGTVQPADSAVQARYRVKGAKKWTVSDPISPAVDGTFVWRLKTPKQVRIVMASSQARSTPVKIAAAKRPSTRVVVAPGAPSDV